MTEWVQTEWMIVRTIDLDSSVVGGGGASPDFEWSLVANMG